MKLTFALPNDHTRHYYPHPWITPVAATANTLHIKDQYTYAAMKLTFEPPKVFFIRQAAALSNKKETMEAKRSPIATQSMLEINTCCEKVGQKNRGQNDQMYLGCG